MQSRDFCFWLQGFFELSDKADHITADQATLIRRHLDLVFAHEIAPALREAPVRPPEPAPAPPRPAPEKDGPVQPQQPFPEPPPVRC